MACKQLVLETMVSPATIPGTWVTLPKDVEQAISAQSIATNKALYPGFGWWGEVQQGYVDQTGDYWAIVDEIPYPISDGTTNPPPPMMKKTVVYHCLQSTLAPGIGQPGSYWVPAAIGSTIIAGMAYLFLRK